MSEVLGQVGKLSPERRALLQKILRQRTGPAHEPGAIRPRASGGPAPLSFAQERLWFIDRFEPGSATYNIPVAQRLAGALDQAALERSLGEIVRRHEALRTTFGEVDGSPVQVITPFGGFALPVEDLSGLGEADREAAVRRRAGEEARRGFDLSAGPLFRAALLRLGEEDHVLLLSMHHIVSDGWSLGVLFREMSALYEAYREGRESPLPELAVQYADYAVWQREQLAGEALDRQLSYWREQLAGAPELLELPTDHPRPAVQTYRGASVPVELSLELLERLQALGRSEEATLYMVLLSAFQVLLAKYTASEDIVVGTPIAGRTRKEVEELVGFFVNTLVLRTDLSGDPSFREVLRRAREVTLKAYEHQEVPFEKLVAELQPERSLSHSPLFQVMFTLQNAGGGGGALPGLGVSRIGTELTSAKFDISLELVVTPQGLRGGLDYSTDLFERSTVDRIIDHLARVLEQVATDADVRLSQLELLAAEEREQVLGAWNHTARRYSDPPAHALFAEWARRAPEATALLDGGQAMTYGALDRRAAILARHLRDLGVGPETPVGLCMERTPELLVGVLGIWKAGGAYVPLDPAYPAERLGWIITDAALPVVVATGDTAGVLPEHGATLVRVDQLAETEAAPEVPVSDASLAYVIYTSGSTGRPKGVLVPHGSLSNLLAATREAFGVSEGDVMPALASYAFDIWLFEALLPLTSGAAVRLVDRDRVLDVPALVEEIADATLMHAVPALMRQLVQAERETPRLGRLRRAFVGGDRVPADLLAEMREALPGAESHVLYGPTEGTILTSVHPVPADGLVEGHPIGRPLGNVRLYVCDALGSPQPAGVPGELLIGGAGVARGYLGRASVTAERFVPDAFGSEPGARLYRSGDRARWRTDGTLEYLGRTDFQVKVRGFRIELGEIEAVLRQHESVTDCVVVAREDVPGDRRLVAYVAGSVEADELREHLRENLPEYMVPAAFVVLEQLPLTPNGKVDRKALPAPEYASAEESYVAPRTPVEEVMAGIWVEVLKVERVGVHDNFFALGGHSLLAVTLVERMRRRGVRADIRALFTTPTVAELAASVEGAGSDVQVPPNRIPADCNAITPEMLPLVELMQGEVDRIVAGVPGGAENVQDIYPLAPLQEGILFHHLLTPESDPYLLPQPFAFDSREQLHAYLDALQAAVARHDILRTSVVWEGLSEPVQVVWREAPLSVEEVEVDPDAGDAARHLYERIDPLHQRVDLSRAPLLRAYIGHEAVGGRWGLLLLLHHMVSDHTTADVLREEMEAHLDGRADQLPAPLPFRNYVAQARLGVSRAEHEAFFRELLGDVDEPTAPFGLREVRGDGLGLEQGTLRVEGELGVRLRERARRLGVSPAAVCHVAWAQVLARASGRSDVVFGTVLFGRMEGGEGAERVLGPFINTLPVRIGVGEQGAESSVRRTQALLASLVRHEHASLALAQQYSGVPAPEPLFSALFNYRHTAGGSGGKGSARGPRQAMHVIERSNYPLNLSVNDWGEEFSLSVQAEAEVGAQRVCALMHQALAGLVEALEEAPERPLASIEVLPQAERRQVLEAWNRTEAEYPADRCIHELFEAQAARTPGAVAVVFEDASLPYRELNERANRLAHHLVRLGVGPEVRVGLCLERSLEMVVSLLAVLKAGGAYVPLDPGLPAERLAYMLDDSATPVLLTRETLRGALPAVEGVEVVSLDGAAEEIAAEPSENPTGGAGPNSLAYVIYTSGSTGRPKGVMNQHRGVVNRLVWMQAHFGIGADDVVLQKTPFGFDVSVWEFFWPLQQGARLVMARPDGHRDPAYLRDVVEREGVTTLHFVPSMLQPFVETVEAGRCASLRHVVCSGEALPAVLVRRFYDRFAGPVVLTNLYGPTEAAVDVSCWTCPRDGAAGVVPIGRPVWNTALYVLDAGLRPVPVGTPGELYIGGVQVARGYQDRAAMTAERFVPDPFSVQGGARLYRTGDRARWRADGAIEYLGRLDFQVKVRGFRIELGEIEEVLRQYESVADCVVMARAETGEPRLVAYVVGEAGADELRAHVRQSLPEYMVPAVFVPMDALPLTPNGKLDRKALPAPEYAANADRYVAPRTPVEEVLAGIWAEVLRLERVGVEESFFDLGGHSLLATRVVSRIRDVFAIELPLRALFEGPTVAELAGRVEEMRRAELPVLPPLVPTERTGALPLSFAQERLWFLDRLEPGSATYNIPAALRLAGALDEAALERALGEIVRRHEALRTTFTEMDGSPVQVVAPFGGFTLPVEDLSGLGEAAARLRVGEEARRGFDLPVGPLLRAALLRLGAEDHVLLLTIHHIVSDGWSMGVLFRELSTLYAAYREGGESPLPELAVQYADYAVWQREQLAGEALDRQMAYWKERLAGAPELLELPTDHPRPAVQTFRGAHERIELPLELLERLQRLGRSEGATLYMVMLAAFQVLLSKYAGSEDVVVGSPIAGRTRREIEELIGFFVNTLVLRTDLSGDPSFHETLRRAREVTLGAYEHQEVPFEKLVAELQPERSLSHSPLFQVAFSLQDRNQPTGGLTGLQGGGVEAELGTTKFDLELNFAVHAQGLGGGLAYRTDLFERGTIVRMLGHLQRVLEQVATDADVRLSQLELLRDAEREQVLGTWNHTERQYSDPPAHALFGEWVRRAPEATALLDSGEAVTYGALDQRAAILARHLRDLGVGPETPVGLCMERTPELLVGVLGIWKAGGAYVPLDPAYPAERLGWIISDAALPVVVATGSTAGALPEHGATLVRVDELPDTAAEVPASEADLAYVIYTSGSTGRPKGVLVQHGSLSNLLAATREAFGVREGDVMPALASYAFDIWLFETLLPLTSGATVRLVERDRVLDVPALVEEIADATLVHAVPALMRQLVQAERETPCLAQLRCAFVGGDRVPADLLAEMREALSGAETHVLYGPTEGTILASTHPVPEDGAVYGHPIGAPLGNVRLYVSDALGNAQPAGVAGELLIGGAGVARGYLGRSAMTAERFVPDAFGSEPGARLYRTGDRARWRADGTLEYLGRTDFQVKVRGFRIEPGEIEAVLRGHESVTDCAVVAREDVPGDRRLVAYVAGGVEADELREYLRGSLPDYMVPAAFVVLEQLPLTPNGKLDRKALPAPEYASAEESYAAPRTPVEEVMAGIWAEVLKVERVGVHDNFFSLGGHSLLAVTLVERMRRRGVRADVRALFTAPTVAELAAGVEETGSDVRVPANLIPDGCGAITPEMLPLVELTQGEIDRVVDGVPGGAENVQDIYPLAPLQEGILFHHLLTPESDPYLLPQPFAFESREQRDAYLAALQAAVARHDILRTAVMWEGLSEPVQVVWRHAPLSVEEVEVDPAAGDAARHLYERIDPRHQRVDLRRAPMLRAWVAREAVGGRWGLLLLLHHMVSDHTTADVLREEMEAHLDGRADQLPAPLPFRNYVAQARLGVSRAEHEAFFRDLLGDIDEPTAPFGLREVRGDGLGLEQGTLRVEGELGVRLRERARRLGVSPAAVCHVAWAQVLARASGRDDVVFGTVLFGRMEGGEGAERVLGPFINTLPVRIGVGEGAEASVRRTQALLASLVRHEHASLALAQQYSGVPAPEPLFSALFNYRHAAGGGGGKGSARGPRQAMHVMERSNYPLNLSVNDWGEEFSLSVQAEAEVGAERVCALMHQALAGLVEALEKAPERPLETIEVLPEAERRQVLEAWNRTQAEYPADRCIHELFEAQAARTPGAVAVVFEDASLTYRELNERANRLAHQLVRLGVGPEVRVGVLMERSLEMVVSLLAALKAGGAYVPLDPAYPAERLALMLADSAASVLLTQQKLRGLLVVGPGVHVVVEEEIADQSAENVESRVGPRNLAYLIYTSGSTGIPKGVAIEHESAVVMLAWAWSVYSDEELSGMLASTSISFDMSVFELFTPLTRGGRVIVVENALALPQSAAADQVRLLDTVPSAAAALLKSGGIPSGVKTVNLGGEPLRAELVDALYAHGVERVYDVYGPSEDTTFSTYALRRPGGPVTIGRVLSNSQAYVVDAGLRPVPVGVPGELYLGGRGVTRGYLGRPGLTAERYVPDPFSPEAGARMYRTGDRIRWKADGTLEYLGRLDHQVKVRGFRVETGEIEAVLRRHESVADCVVMARADAGEQRLVAYVVGEARAEELRAHVRRSLPEYMLPSAFVFLNALPLTPNGKLDRKALPAPELASAEDRYVAPRTPVEEVLAGIWAEVLRLERVGVEESFFELGGHSLLATRVVSRVREVFGVELPLRALFEGPMVAQLAVRVDEMRRAELPVLPPLVPTERTGSLPLSFAQERLWFIDRLEPGSATYNIPAALRLAGALDERALERALGEIVRRHEALRTVFGEVDGSPVQVIAPFGTFALPVEDLSGLDEADREAVVRRLAGEEASRPFDLSAGPLFRVALLRLDAEDHVLLLSMHHIVSDGWSTGVLLRELSTLYAAYCEGRESPLPDLPVQYADYAVWQREQLAGEVLDRQLSYWREQLAGAPELLEMPTDRPRPAVQTYRGASVPVEISVELLERLQRLGRSEGATLYMTVLGAFQVLLSKYAGSEDIVVGSPIAGRTRKEVEELIGFFVNTLVLRTDLSGDPPFREVLRRVREATLGAYEHQELPFEKLVAELQPERSLSHSPLFQVMFALQDAEGGGGALPGLKASGVGSEIASARFDLSLTLAATPRGLGGGLIYRTDLFEPDTMERMVRYLERVLEQVAADADVRLSQLDLLGEAERARVLEEGSRTAAEYPAERCIHEMFEAQAARTPDAVALTFGAESVTYAELDARANRLARHLLQRGARPDSLVGLLVERSVETVVGILGILKAGAGYLPLEPADPDDRLAWVLEDSGAPIIVTTSALAPRVAGGGAEIVSFDSSTAESLVAPAVDVAPGSLAYVIYTSGSTGRPKGVQVTHANVVRLFAATDPWFGFGAQDVWTLFHSYAFDFSVWEIWGALLYGGRLVVVPFQVSRSPEEFYALLEAERVTVLNQTPSAFRQLMRADEEAAERGEARELALRYVVFGGEALDPAILRGWVDRRGDDRPVLVNMYGITETTVHVTYRVVREADVRGGSSSPIGVPIPDLSVHLLDRNGQLVPTGMVGEMYVGGGGVARGYLHRPELTAERFVRDPFSSDPAARLYRSGDLARRRVDGSLEFMGRADDQVKVRGFRIELREIESVLLDHPAVRETVVLTRGEGEEKRLVAWFVAAGEVGAAELRAHLLAHLPGHMVPSAFVRLDALPLTRNGKVDRRALPEPDADDLAGAHFVAPGTPTEEMLANLWAQLLGAERVGATDDFFMLGGHSLLATRLASRVRRDLRVELPIRAVFEHSTLGALAAEVDRLRRGGVGVEAPPIVPVPRDGDLPLSLAQERLWFVDRMEPGSATYHMPLFVRLEGELDEGAFRRAVDELVRRHESLRTSFPLVDGAPVQRVAPPAPAELVFHDLSTLRDDEREDESARLVREQARTPFWLETGPLFRADLVKLGEGDHLFLATLHHAIADGWSVDLLWHELAALYGSFSRGEASPLPEPRIQYGDFSVWQRAWLQGEVLERQVAFWRRALEGAPPLLALPADRPRPAVQTHNGAVEHAFLPREVTDGVLSLARQEGATLFMVLMAALDLVLSRQSGQQDVVVGTPIAGRTRAETDRVVGLFLNSLALRVSLAGDPAFRELLGRVRDTTLDAYAHQDAPFEAVLEEIQPERAQDRTPVFQVMLNLANFAGAGEVTAAEDAPSGFGGLRVRGVDQGAGALAAKFDFTLYAGEGPDGIGLHLVYNTDLFEAGRMAALLAQVVAVLEQALEDPVRPVSRFVLADGRAPSGADRELRTAAGLPAGVGEPGEVWERHDGGWAATRERGRYLPDGSIAIAIASATPMPEAETEPAARTAPAAREPDAGAELTETEREMLAIWHEVLGEPVELHDDFFELGGHSLLGVRLLALVKKRLGRTLALPVLFGASTPAALSAQVDDTGEGRGFVHLVPMGGEQGTLPPIFLVHPAGGTVFKYADLTRHLGPDRPVYAIQAAGVTDGAEPLRTVDLMAQAYLEEVLRLQPQGPYYLAGWSAGGVIVMEMAHRLRAAGYEVALAGLLDSSPPNSEKPVPDPVHLYRRLASGLSSTEAAELDALEVEIRALPIDDRLPYLARWLGAHGAESRLAELDGLRPVVEVFRANVAATRRHPLAPYPGRVTLFCAELGRGEGWKKAGLPEVWKPFVTGELEVVVVPGTHISMVDEPNVRGVAAAIQAAIAGS